MRVAFIHPFLFRYARGIERYTFNLANALAAQGVEVSLLTWRWQSPVQIDLLDDRVRVHVLPTLRYFAAQAIIPFYVWHLLTHRYDFVWIYFADYGEAMALNGLRQQKFGVVFHYPYAQVPHRYHSFRRTGLARRAAYLVAVSRFVADGVRQALGRESVVIHHGVDTVRFAPDATARVRVRESLGLAADVPLLVTAAALEERKGIQCVLRALPRVIEQFPNAMYLVLGAGPHRAVLEQLACDLQIQEHVRLLGAQADVTPYLQAADVSLILARGEASSLSALESLACEIPVIAARQPPFDELISSEYGVMVDETDANAVTDAIIGVLREPAWRAQMGAAGRARVLADFTWEQLARRYVLLLNSIPGRST
jgi:phosphatidylinositol alpha-1,6-mannosyltransferase